MESPSANLSSALRFIVRGGSVLYCMSLVFSESSADPPITPASDNVFATAPMVRLVNVFPIAMCTPLASLDCIAGIPFVTSA